jgi:hypothetical protein
MSDGTTSDERTPQPGEQQSGASAEANKPEEARAKGESGAGNILGGVQPDE